MERKPEENKNYSEKYPATFRMTDEHKRKQRTQAWKYDRLKTTSIGDDYGSDFGENTTYPLFRDSYSSEISCQQVFLNDDKRKNGTSSKQSTPIFQQTEN